MLHPGTSLMDFRELMDFRWISGGQCRGVPKNPRVWGSHWNRMGLILWKHSRKGKSSRAGAPDGFLVHHVGACS